jgi:hypothetical protein
VLDNVDEEGCRTLVARRSNHAHHGLTLFRGARSERLSEGGIRFVGPDLHDGAKRVTLNRGLFVVEKHREIRQRVGAAKRA